MSVIDQSSSVRPSEELPIESLSEYLSAHLPDVRGPLIVEQFPSGVSNLTYLRRAGNRELVLRRPPVGAKIKTAHDMSREYRILSHLSPIYEKVPRPLLFCDDESILGAPFYVMERVTGIILRAQRPTGIDLAPELMRRLSETFIETLIEIHELDYQSAGLGNLGSPQGYVSRQVEGWTRRYFNARTDDVPAIEKLAEWLQANLPPDSERAGLIHNDYKYDNLVLAPDDPAHVIAVLDWEMATIGDPLMDFGTSLGYWIQADDPPVFHVKVFGPTHLPGNLTRIELVERWSRATGRDATNIVFYYAFALFKLAVVGQQLYKRWVDGLTKEDRYA